MRNEWKPWLLRGSSISNRKGTKGGSNLRASASIAQPSSPMGPRTTNLLETDNENYDENFDENYEDGQPLETDAVCTLGQVLEGLHIFSSFKLNIYGHVLFTSPPGRNILDLRAGKMGPLIIRMLIVSTCWTQVPVLLSTFSRSSKPKGDTSWTSWQGHVILTWSGISRSVT